MANAHTERDVPTRIAGYYDELQRREGLNPIELITKWAQDDADVFQRLFIMRLLHPECTLCPPLWRDLSATSRSSRENSSTRTGLPV